MHKQNEIKCSLCLTNWSFVYSLYSKTHRTKFTYLYLFWNYANLEKGVSTELASCSEIVGRTQTISFHSGSQIQTKHALCWLLQYLYYKINICWHSHQVYCSKQLKTIVMYRPVLTRALGTGMFCGVASICWIQYLCLLI